ncbi:phytanoyl-CoA dioxygenase family protein [Streptomyces parvus]|uniref:phytanoyl-CoA dioxygenase family protein n=1 Tax=Streptomyces parvus TaxID=66428 RepID=UPI0036BAD5DC
MSEPDNARLRAIASSAPIDETLGIFREDGGVIIQGLRDRDQVERLNREIDPAIQELSPGWKHDDDLAADFHGRNTKRLTNLVTRSETFAREVVDHDLVHVLADAVFLEESGTYWMTTAQVIEIGPGNAAQMLHRDLENWYPLVGMGPASPEVAVNFLIALSEFTDENGATRVISGSHTWSDLEDRGIPAQTLPAEMGPGDALFCSGKTAHGGGANVTKDAYRRAVSFALNPGFLVGEEAYPFLVDRERARTLSPRVQRLIGFRSQYPKGSPGLWQVDYAELADYLGL